MSEYTMKHIIRGVVLTDTPKSNLMDWRDQLLNQGLATNLDWIFGHFLGPVCTWTTDGESGAGSAARTSPTPVNSSAAVSAVQPAASAANPTDAEDEEAAAVIVNTAQQETVPAAGPGSSKKWAPEGLSMEDVRQRERQMVAYMRRHISPRIQLVTRANELLTPWEILEAVHQLLAPRDRGIIQAKLGAMYRLRQGSRTFSDWMQLVRKHAEDLRLHGHNCDEYMLKSVFVDGLEGQLYEIDQRHLRDYVLSDKRTVQHCHDHLVSVYGFRTARAITDGTCARKPKNSSPGALTAHGGSRGGNRNSGRGSNSHRSYSAANSGIICYGCGQRGHRRAECPASHNQRAPQQLGMAAAGMGGRRGGPGMGRAPAGRPGMRGAPASRQPGAPAGTQCEYCRKPGHTQDVCYLRKSHQATRRAQGLAAHTRDFDDDSVFALMADTQPPETEPLDGGQEPGEQTEEEAGEMHVPEAPAGFRGFTPEQHMRQYQPYQRMTRACQQAHTTYEQLSASIESLMMELQDAREAHRAVQERLDKIYRRAQQAAEEQRISSLTEAEAELLSPTYSGQLAAEPAVVEMDDANGVHTAPGPPEVQEIDGVDLTGYYFKGYPNAPSDEVIYSIKRAAFLNGVTITGTGVRNDFALTDPSSRRGHIQLVKEWVDVAAKLGSDMVRVFSGREHPKGYTFEQVLEWMVPAFQECAEYGAKRGVIIGLQHHDDFLKTAEQTIRVVDLVKSDWFSVILDVGSLRQGDPYAEIEKLLPYASNWQVKEHVWYGTKKVEIDLPRIRKIIDKVGYRGFTPIEALGEGDPRAIVTAFLGKVRQAFA